MARRSLEQQQVRLLYENAVRQAMGEIADAGQYPSQQRSFPLYRNGLHLSPASTLPALPIKSVRTNLGP